jgi:hypothetical protein
MEPEIMPTTRRPLRHATRPHLNGAVINAWRRCDTLGLYEALDLAPFERIPLPRVICSLGVDQDDVPEADDFHGVRQAQELQKQLLETVGPPDPDAVRGAYQRNLEHHQEMAAFYEKEIQIKRPCSNPESQRVWLERDRAAVKHYEKLIAELDA